MKIHTHKLQRTLKRLLITVGILLAMAIIGGMVYVYIGDHTDTKQVPTAVSSPAPVDPIPKTQEPGPNAPESAAVQYLSSPVRPGENATITVTTGPNSACTIVVAYNEVASKDSGLTPRKADLHGSVTWAWTVDRTAALGKWPVKVTCVRNNKTGYVEGDLVVTK